MSISDIIDCMENLDDIHQLLLDLAEQKKQSLIHNEVETMNQIAMKENQLIRQISELEEQRTHAVNRFLITKCYRPDPRVTLNDLIKLVFHAGDKQALTAAQKKLLNTVNQLKIANEQNQQLVQQSLAFIEYSLDLMVGPPEDEVIYKNPTGGSKGLKRSGTFDTRA